MKPSERILGIRAGMLIENNIDQHEYKASVGERAILHYLDEQFGTRIEVDARFIPEGLPIIEDGLKEEDIKEIYKAASMLPGEHPEKEGKWDGKSGIDHKQYFKENPVDPEKEEKTHNGGYKQCPCGEILQTVEAESEHVKLGHFLVNEKEEKETHCRRCGRKSVMIDMKDCPFCDNLISRSQVLQLIEEMQKKDDSEEPAPAGIIREWLLMDGYNEALFDLLERIKKL